MGLWNWSTTAANNATADPSINWQEGQAPSTVNDSARAMMAALAVQFQTGWEWQMWGDTPTYVSGTQFTVPGNLTGRYTVGRRIRASVTAGTIYGAITASAYTSLTTVTVTWDSGSLDSGLTEVDVGIINPTNTSFPRGINAYFSNAYANGTLQVTGSNLVAGTQGAWMAWNEVPGNGATSLINNQGTGGGGFIFRNVNSSNTIETGRVTFSSAGDITAGGTITANSDERLKEDWGDLPDDFIDRLASIRSGTYTRVDSGQRHVGVGAQSLRALLPEAVMESDKGVLSVAYGQAALAACVELAKEVVRLRALLEPSK
ncbi:tail fiber domain-containing protein [Burkholderia orbicola]|uniref:tail fiber domain-containing protein n=1 Tax=Burkholderia orbicola TaxID=2978683 RepID=UPI00264BEF59|nr:tail fiber domain-containing protein [Burkholderia orbicola]MDN7993585.1 tail fiber domain-containing protein [Burkholderia orbicola]